MQNLQNQLHSKTDEHGKLKQLFDALQRGSDQEATTLLARLRLGDSIDDLLSYVGVGQQSSSSGCAISSTLHYHACGLNEHLDCDTKLNSANM